MSDFTHTFEAEPGTLVDEVEIGDIKFIQKHGFGALYGPFETSGELNEFVDGNGWVFYVEGEPEETGEPAQDE